MAEITQTRSIDGFVSLMEEQLSNGNFSEALKIVRDPVAVHILKDRAWELIPIISKYLVEATIEKYPGIDDGCVDILEQVVEIAQPEETLLELLEQAECLENNVKFIALLKPIGKCLNKLTSNRDTSIQWCLGTMQDHVVNLPIPESIGIEERIKPKDTDPWCLRITDAYSAILQFYKPFVLEVSRQISVGVGSLDPQTLINHRKSLVCFILQLLGKPLMHLDLHVKGDSKPGKARIIAEELVSGLSLLTSDLLMFLQYAESREIEGRCKMQIPSKEMSLDACQREYKMPTLSIAVLYYLIYAEEIHVDKVPCVYSPLYLFQNSLYLATALLKRTFDAEDFLIPKGLLLAESVLSRIADLTVPYQVLDSAIHNNFIDALTMVSIYCLDLENRKLSVAILRSYLFKFDMKGRYLLMSNIVSIVTHPPLMGYLVMLLKDMIVPVKIRKPHLPMPYFNGQRLAGLIKKYTALPQGRINLSDIKEQVLASLSMLLYLLVRDETNATGIWDHIKNFEDWLLNPLKTAIDSSRAENNNRLKERENEKATSKKKEKEEPILSVSIMGRGDVEVPENENNEDIHLALNSFDLMESSLVMVVKRIENGPVNHSALKLQGLNKKE